ncbi:MAG: carbamoyl-phosphate synthase large subunit [bacterium JZ-2024 1]
MPKRTDLERILLIGSGPIIIGQAAEFDYSGSQACRALREEGYEVLLVNSNPATIMTDTETADIVYIEPLTPESITKIIAKERPQAILPTLGGQTGLNLAVLLSERGVLEQYNVEILGTPLRSIQYAEDRELFRQLMLEINEPVPRSRSCVSVDEAIEFARENGFPVIVRPAYTLGGTGGGIAHSFEELVLITERGLQWSLTHQVLVEEYLQGWGEIEYEVIRDADDNCITVCNMENFDPMGVHTGDSIVIAPSQSLTDRAYQMLRTASIGIIRALKIEGGCNIQFALSPDQRRYHVIEVNPRVSRSSALASKATGYPIARVAAKIAVGLRLWEIPNPITGKTYASFEPALDYVVTKIPRFPFDKFVHANRRLGSQMKATGEVMAVGRSFEESLLKAVRSLELDLFGLRHREAQSQSDAVLEAKIREPNDLRLFAVAEALRRGVSAQTIHEWSGIPKFFIERIGRIVEMERKISQMPLSPDHLREAKELGFSDVEIASLTGKTEDEIRQLRLQCGIKPVYKCVDTCSAEFEAETPYFYSTYDRDDEKVPAPGRSMAVISSGPIRIGQGIEFDYCCVHAVKALREQGIEAVMINNNPETVSTDFDISDRLYFEPLTVEDILNVLDRENPRGIIVQFGGQTPLNLAGELSKRVPIIGTSYEAIDTAEDRAKMAELLQRLGIPYPPGAAVYSREAALNAAREIGFPVLARPSYVLGGRSMEILYSEDDLNDLWDRATGLVVPGKPLLVDKYVPGVELEVDGLSDGEEIFIPGIMKHLERAGIHSGDSIAVYPPIGVSSATRRKVVEFTSAIARALGVKGLLNIQFVEHQGVLYVLEVNPRASRTVPFISKATGIPLVRWAVEIALGKTIRDLGVSPGVHPEGLFVSVKAPVFSFSKLEQVDASLGPEMKSTGEIMGIGYSFAEALYKVFLTLYRGDIHPREGGCLLTVADRDKSQGLDIARFLHNLGFPIYSTVGTANFLRAHGVPAIPVRKIHEGEPNLLSVVHSRKVNLLINTVSPSRISETDGVRIRRACVEMQIPIFTSLDTAQIFLSEFVRRRLQGTDWEPISLNEVLAASRYEGVRVRAHL